MTIHEYTAEEQKLIVSALKEHKPWDVTELKNLKTRLKVYLLETTKNQCCYCRKNMNGEFAMVIDIEHVLPQAKYKPYTFSIFNLSVSCKRCNMPIKGQKDDFYDGPDPLLSGSYKIIHPNHDSYFYHMHYYESTFNGTVAVKYHVQNGSAKGMYTYNYFKLQRREVGALDEMQGLTATEPLLADIAAVAPQELLDQFS